MANELQLQYLGTGIPTIVAIIKNTVDQWYNANTQAFESYNAANIAFYAAATFAQIGNTPEYAATFPVLPAGKYGVSAYTRAGASLAVSDLAAASFITSGSIDWTGTAEISLAVSQAGQNTALTNIASQESVEIAAEATATALATVASNVTAIQTAVTSETTGITAISTTLTAGVNLNLTQAIPTSNTAQTVGDALNAARAQGFGKWVETASTNTITLYAADGTTVVRTFTYDSLTAPTIRQ